MCFDVPQVLAARLQNEKFQQSTDSTQSTKFKEAKGSSDDSELLAHYVLEDGPTALLEESLIDGPAAMTQVKASKARACCGKYLECATDFGKCFGTESYTVAGKCEC